MKAGSIILSIVKDTPAGFGVLKLVSQMGGQMSVSEADLEWSEWSVRFEPLHISGWSVSHKTDWILTAH